MIIKEGYSYHISDSYFQKFSHLPNFASNKENGNYRPHYFALADKNIDGLYWIIPISSQVSKYKRIIADKIKKYKKCDTIVIGEFNGSENAFLIQNAIPMISQYVDHVHKVSGVEITIHKKLEKELKHKMNSVLVLHKKGISLLYTDIDTILKDLLLELNSNH